MDKDGEFILDEKGKYVMVDQEEAERRSGDTCKHVAVLFGVFRQSIVNFVSGIFSGIQEFRKTYYENPTAPDPEYAKLKTSQPASANLEITVHPDDSFKNFRL